MGQGGSAISQPVHGGGLIAGVNNKGATHDLCHLPTYQRQEDFVVTCNVQLKEKGTWELGVMLRLCIRLNHSAQFVKLLSSLHVRQQVGAWLCRATPSAGTLVDQDPSFLF